MSIDKESISMKRSLSKRKGSRKILVYEGMYLNNLRHGWWKSYYENGQLWWDGNYHKDNLNGSTRVYFLNGQLAWEGCFDHGSQEGERLGYEY